MLHYLEKLERNRPAPIHHRKGQPGAQASDLRYWHSET
jgi:hypothetical protein